MKTMTQNLLSQSLNGPDLQDQFLELENQTKKSILPGEDSNNNFITPSRVYINNYYTQKLRNHRKRGGIQSNSINYKSKMYHNNVKSLPAKDSFPKGPQYSVLNMFTQKQKQNPNKNDISQYQKQILNEGVKHYQIRDSFNNIVINYAPNGYKNTPSQNLNSNQRYTTLKVNDDENKRCLSMMSFYDYEQNRPKTIQTINFLSNQKKQLSQQESFSQNSCQNALAKASDNPAVGDVITTKSQASVKSMISENRKYRKNNGEEIWPQTQKKLISTTFSEDQNKQQIYGINNNNTIEINGKDIQFNNNFMNQQKYDRDSSIKYDNENQNNATKKLYFELQQTSESAQAPHKQLQLKRKFISNQMKKITNYVRNTINVEQQNYFPQQRGISVQSDSKGQYKHQQMQLYQVITGQQQQVQFNKAIQTFQKIKQCFEIFKNNQEKIMEKSYSVYSDKTTSDLSNKVRNQQRENYHLQSLKNTTPCTTQNLINSHQLKSQFSQQLHSKQCNKEVNVIGKNTQHNNFIEKCKILHFGFKLIDKIIVHKYKYQFIINLISQKKL